MFNNLFYKQNVDIVKKTGLSRATIYRVLSDLGLR
ncbi:MULTISPECIES: helix-turn-helix domain-containing protein [Clostridium]